MGPVRAWRGRVRPRALGRNEVLFSRELQPIRQEKLRPKLDDLHEWLVEAKERVPPKSLTGKAMGYLDSQWSRLIGVLEDGRLELSTNAIERAIRPFVIRCPYCTPYSSIREQRTLRFSRRPTRAAARRQGVSHALVA